MRIVLLDDSATSRLIVSRIMKTAGHEFVDDPDRFLSELAAFLPGERPST